MTTNSWHDTIADELLELTAISGSDGDPARQQVRSGGVGRGIWPGDDRGVVEGSYARSDWGRASYEIGRICDGSERPKQGTALNCLWVGR